jgi:hypothetical protein
MARRLQGGGEIPDQPVNDYARGNKLLQGLPRIVAPSGIGRDKLLG